MTATPTQLVRRLIICGLTINLLVVALVTFAVEHHRTRDGEQATVTLRNLSRILEHNISDFLDRVDLILLSVGDEITDPRAEADAAKIGTVLARNHTRLPKGISLRLVDAEGTARHLAGEASDTPINVADRPYFIALRDDPQAGVVVSKPLMDRISGKWVIVLGRRISHPDGSFAGEVHAAIAIEQFVKVFATLDIGPQGLVALRADDLSMVARYPEPDGFGSTIGNTAASDTYRELMRTGQDTGLYTAASGIDGIERLFLSQKIPGYPLHVIIALATGDYLADWRHNSILLATLATILVLSVSIAIWVIIRFWRRQSLRDAAYTAELLRSREDAEVARQRSEQILSSAGEGVCGIDLEGRITFLNQAGREMLGLDEGEGIGANLHALAHHHHADGSVYPIEDCPLHQTLRDGLPRQVDSDVYWRQDGTCVPVELSTAPIYQDGKLAGAVNVFRDVSRRLRAEERVAHNMAITAAMEGVLRRSLENAPLETILDYALAEVLALPWLNLEDRGCIFLVDSMGGQLHLAAERNLSPQVVGSCTTVDFGYCLCGRVAASGESIFIDGLDYRHETSYPGMREHGHYCVPIMAAGEVLGVLNTYVEHGHRYDEDEERFLVMFADTLAGIIERKRVEEDLRDSQNRMMAITSNLFEGILLVSSGGDIVFANRSAQRVLENETLVGRPLDAVMTLLVRGEALTFPHGPFRRVIETGETMVDDDAVFAIGGGRRLAVAYAAGYLREEGKSDAVIISFRDIGALKAAQREVMQASRLASVGQLAAGIAHEINTPVQYIGDNLRFIDNALGKISDVLAAGQELASGGSTQPEMAGPVARFENAVKTVKLPFLLAEAPAAVKEALEGVTQIARIVLSMKEFSHPGTSSKTMSDLNRALESTLTVSHAVWKEVAEVETRFDAALPPVLCYAGEMNQVFLNLIVNAAHAIEASGKPLPGRITITTRHGDGYAEITVADSGTGVPEAIKDRIFDPFFTTKAVGKGTGQGLAICRDVVVTKHGGCLDVVGEDGKGAVFIVQLPISESEMATEGSQ